MSASNKVSFLLYNFNRDRESLEEEREEKRNEGKHTESTRKMKGRVEKRTRENDAKHPPRVPLLLLHSVQHPLTSQPRTASVSIDWDT